MLLNLPSVLRIYFLDVYLAHELAHIQHMDFVFRSALLALAIIVTYKVCCKAPRCKTSSAPPLIQMCIYV